MESQSRLQKSLIAKTEEHNRHRLEIIEDTIVNERGSHFEEVRNKLLLNKMYEKFLTQTIIHEMRAHNKLEDAYQKVKLKTGLHNIDEIIERFLTQEASYRELTAGLHLKEDQCNHYKEKLKLLQTALADLETKKPSRDEDQQSVSRALIVINQSQSKKEELEGVVLKINTWVDNMLKKVDHRLSQEEITHFSIEKKLIVLKGCIFSVLETSKSEKTLNVSMDETKKKALQDIIEKYKLTKSVYELTDQKRKSKSLSKKSSRAHRN